MSQENFASGWSAIGKKEQKKTVNAKTFFVPPKENRSIVFLDSEPITVIQHHYCDTRLYNHKKQAYGVWGNFATCVSGMPGYSFCPFCKAERILKNGFKSKRISRVFLTIFDLYKFKDDKGVEWVSGRKLFPMSEEAADTLRNDIEQNSTEEKEFSLVGAEYNCYRSSENSEAIGNQLTYKRTVSLEKLKKSFPNSPVEPYNYREIFEPLEMEDMKDDIQVITKTKIFNAEIESSEDEIPF